MIPNFLATTGPSAAVWSYWKSIDHALSRALSYSRANELTELDRDRLSSLAKFLRKGLELRKPSAVGSFDVLRYVENTEPVYGSLVDMQRQLIAVEEFNKWRKPARQSFEHDVQRLIDCLESVLGTQTKRLFVNDVPPEELTVLHAIVRSLLLQAEITL